MIIVDYEAWQFCPHSSVGRVYGGAALSWSEGRGPLLSCVEQLLAHFAEFEYVACFFEIYAEI
ncbi:hypothetical protein BJF95_05925 [Rhizobium oryziradicis]|uniref:Uncharacterized protein n=1 Tax=Rhizobium oryziradicis TaxID=1867956 RepID=A0A1Q8ZQB7_9HYPH|nr:hypothetical protein BJF95_05925 [Rhizobium oryziradicis]